MELMSGQHRIDLQSLRARVAAELRPGLVKARSCVRADRKVRAAWAFAQALDYLKWSKRHAAEYVGTDDKTIRLWLDGAQQPAWIPLALPRDGQLRYFEALMEDMPPDSARTGTDG